MTLFLEAFNVRQIGLPNRYQVAAGVDTDFYHLTGLFLAYHGFASLPDIYLIRPHALWQAFETEPARHLLYLPFL